MPRHAGADWIDRHWEELRDFNRQWIAATAADGLLEHSESIEALIQRVDERQIDRRAVVFSYVCFDTIA